LKRCVHSCSDIPGYNKILRYDCYKECPPGISIQSEEDPNKCDSKCSYDYPFILILEDLCVASCSIMERSQKFCITSYFENRTNLEIQEIIHDDINKDLEEAFNYSIVNEYNTVLIEENETIYEIVTTRNKNPNSNTTHINLGECEDRLKEYYNIDKDDYLYMLVIDVYIKGKTGPKPIYEVYYPLLNSPYLFQLDLSICDGLKINILYNMELENPELYDKDNPIYNDMCYPYSSKDGVDMTLIDVQKEYKDKNMLICDEGCKFNPNGGKGGCSCEVQTTFPPLSEMKIDKDQLYKFANIKNVANFGALKCFNLLSNKDRIKYNIGIYSFIPTFISYIVCLIIFIKVDFNIIKEKIKDLLWAIENLKYIKNKKENIIEKKVEKVEKIIEHEKPKIIKEYNYLEPIFISIAKEKDYELSDVLFGQLNALKIKNAKRMKRNILMNLKSNSSSDSKTNEFTKSESKLNINNNI